VPLIMRDQNAVVSILNNLQLPIRTPALDGWANRALRWDTITTRVKIAMGGKYTGLSDAYLSVIKSLEHACIACGHRLELIWVDACQLEDAMREKDAAAWEAAWAAVRKADAVLVPGGFGDRGVEGKIAAAKYARESGTPYLGICLGLQVAVIEAARSLLGLADAGSTEFNPATPNPVVVFMPEGSRTHMGGTMRLGSRRTVLQTVDCLAAKLYQKEAHIDERHRHRYEVNPEMVPALEKVGMRFVGRDETGRRMEILELANHPFFMATQYHPEFKSRPGKPSPPFLGLILAASGALNGFFQGGALPPSPSRPFPSPSKARSAREAAAAADDAMSSGN
jgi:CTP synthase